MWLVSEANIQSLFAMTLGDCNNRDTALEWGEVKLLDGVGHSCSHSTFIVLHCLTPGDALILQIRPNF